MKKIVLEIVKDDLPAKRLPSAVWQKLRASAGVGAHKPQKGKGAYNRQSEKLEVRRGVPYFFGASFL